MTRDYATDVLPTDNGGFFPTMKSRMYQMDKWATISGKMHALLYDCVQQGYPGWTLEKNNIVVAFWTQRSEMDQQYGVRGSLIMPGLEPSLSSNSANASVQ